MIPGFDCHIDNYANIPWMTIARHTSAFAFYVIALVQWPGYVVTDWAGEDRAFAYSFASLMFTLVFWCASLFHYLVSAGRVDIDWGEGKIKPKGWLVKTSRRSHRVLLSITMAVSAMTIVQSTSLAMIINHFYIKEDELELKEHVILSLLKVDQIIGFALLVYVLGRLIFEPISLRKPKKNAKRLAKEAKNAEKLAETNLPIDVEECSICVERWANRQLKCGHLICCCCLGEIWKTEQQMLLIRCPFCRQESDLARKLEIQDGGTVKVFECCGEILTLDESASSSSTTGNNTRRWSLEDATSNAVLDIETGEFQNI